MFFHSSVAGHLGYFHVLAIINNATKDTRVQVFVWTYIYFKFSWVYTREQIIGSYVNSVFSHLRNDLLHCFPSFSFPPTMYETSHFSKSSATLDSMIVRPFLLWEAPFCLCISSFPCFSRVYRGLWGNFSVNYLPVIHPLSLRPVVVTG